MKLDIGGPYTIFVIAADSTNFFFFLIFLLGMVSPTLSVMGREMVKLVQPSCFPKTTAYTIIME